MDIQGKVVTILPPVSGTSARGEWKKQEIILEQPGEFSKKVCVSFWGDKASEASSLSVGDDVTVSVNVESREYNGRWYTEVRVWKLSRLGQAGQGPDDAFAEAPPFIADAPEAKNTPEEFDDLPF